MIRIPKYMKRGLRALLMREPQHRFEAFRNIAPRRRTLSGVLSLALRDEATESESTHRASKPDATEN